MGFLFRKNNKKKTTQKVSYPVRIVEPERILRCMKLVDTGLEQVVELVIIEPDPIVAELYHKQLISYAYCLRDLDGVQCRITPNGVRLIFNDLDKAKEVYSFWSNRFLKK